jgi:hypothetical protein
LPDGCGCLCQFFKKGGCVALVACFESAPDQYIGFAVGVLKNIDGLGCSAQACKPVLMK